MTTPTASVTKAETVSRESPLVQGRRVARYQGEVVYLYAFDVAYEMVRKAPVSLLGQPLAEFTVGSSKRTPRQLFFYRPQMVRLPPVERTGPRGTVRIERTVKLLPMGALSIAFRVPFAVETLGDLVEYHDLEFAHGTLQEDARALAEEICRELKPYFIRPPERLLEEEAYTVFCLEAPVAAGAEPVPKAEAWLASHRREIAALLTQETDLEVLSAQEAEESTARYLSYYGNDLLVMDWDAALLVDEPRNFDEPLHVMELANLQLAELEAYDRLLDDSLDRSYRDMRARNLLSRTQVMHELRELRIDLARFSDELSNITKFFGDWHLARVYQGVAARFHLADWHDSINQKVKTLDELYGMLAQDRTNRLMLILEFTIVLLFIIDLIMLFGQGH